MDGQVVVDADAPRPLQRSSLTFRRARPQLEGQAVSGGGPIGLGPTWRKASLGSRKGEGQEVDLRDAPYATFRADAAAPYRVRSSLPSRRRARRTSATHVCPLGRRCSAAHGATDRHAGSVALDPVLKCAGRRPQRPHRSRAGPDLCVADSRESPVAAPQGDSLSRPDGRPAIGDLDGRGVSTTHPAPSSASVDAPTARRADPGSSGVEVGRQAGSVGFLLLAPLVQPLLSGRQERHAWRVSPGVLLVQVEDPPIHRRHVSVVTAGAIGRPVASLPDDALGATDLVYEPLVRVEVDLHLRQRTGLRGGFPLTSGSARRHVAPLCIRPVEALDRAGQDTPATSSWAATATRSEASAGTGRRALMRCCQSWTATTRDAASSTRSRLSSPRRIAFV